MMMKIAGRDENGLAKGLSVETDDNNEGVLRVVDAAPFAYDPVDEAFKVKIEKNAQKIVRRKVTVTAPANDMVYAELNLDVREYGSISWGVKADVAHTFMLQTIQQDFDDTMVLTRPDNDTAGYKQAFTNKIDALTLPFSIQTTAVSLVIRNQDPENPHTYTAYVYLKR